MLFARRKTLQVAVTTGNDCFAECPKHSAKRKKHSAKALPSVALGKGDTAEENTAKGTLPSAFCRALGKDFAECQPRTRQNCSAVTGQKR
jgi:hypothetical protein